MEREPQDPSFYIEIYGKELYCTPENTRGYLYEDDRFDHIFYITKRYKNGDMGGYRIWREMLGEGFDFTARYMITNGFMVESLDEPDTMDREAYFKCYPPVCCHELSVQEEAFVCNYGRFLQYLVVTVEDFTDGA